METELPRSLKPRHVAMIAVGGIIGAGLFVGSGAAIAAAGPAIVVSYALAGLLVILVMRMLSEMAVAVPGLRSFPDFPRAGLGDWAGFLSGWLYWYFWVVAVAIEALAGATIVHGWLPSLSVPTIGIVLMVLLIGVNLLSARSYGEFEFWFSSLKTAAIVVFILLGAAFSLGLTSPAGPTFGNLTAHGGFAPHGVLAVLAGVTSTIFALTGAEIATVAAAESANPAQTVRRIAGTVAARILVFYVLSILLIVTIVPWTRIVPGVSPFTTALDAMRIPGAVTAMNIVVLVAVLSCLNSGLYVTSRILFALAAKGDAPLGLTVLTCRGVPARAILIGSLFSFAALAASVLSPDRVFSFLVNASGALMLFVYLLVAFAQLRVRNRLERTPGATMPIRMWLHPWGSIVAITGMVAVLAAMALTPALSSQFYASLVPLAVVGLGWALRRRSAPPAA